MDWADAWGLYRSKTKGLVIAALYWHIWFKRNNQIFIEKKYIYCMHVL